MTDVNNPPATPKGEDSAPDNAGQPPVDNGSGSNPPVDPAEKARRDQQSKKDKANAENDSLRDDVDYLRMREAERARDEHVQTFLQDNAEDYPDVKSDDPMFKYAQGEEDVKAIASELQNRFKTMQQDALASVQSGSSQELLTDEQIAEREEKLEEETHKTGESRFNRFLDNLDRRKR